MLKSVMVCQRCEVPEVGLLVKNDTTSKLHIEFYVVI